MKITRKSILTGKVHTMDLPVSQEQLDAYEKGEYLQYAFPQLLPEEREFIKTGITPAEWAEKLGSDDDE